MQFQQQFDDRRRRGRVEVAGGLVGEHERRLAHDRASDRDALTLPARHLRRAVIQAMTQPHSFQRRDRPSTPVEVGVRRFVDWYVDYYKVRL